MQNINETEWNALCDGVRKFYEIALHCFGRHQIWRENNVGMEMRMLAHTANHLGAIRQIAKAI